MGLPVPLQFALCAVSYLQVTFRKVSDLLSCFRFSLSYPGFIYFLLLLQNVKLQEGNRVKIGILIICCSFHVRKKAIEVVFWISKSFPAVKHCLFLA